MIQINILSGKINNDMRMTNSDAYKLILKKLTYGIVALSPIFGVCLLLNRYNMRIDDISIFNSPWNDELSYYKQIEGISLYWFPKGFFGYNESTARVFSFGPWSPLLLLPYSAICRVVGIGTWQILIVNILLCLITIVGLIRLFKLRLWQTIFVSVIFVANANIIRYTMSISPELLVILCTIWLFGSLVKYEISKEEKYINLFVLLLIFLSLCRGYFAIFGIAGLTIVKNKKQRIAIAISALGGMVFYLAIVHFMCSPFFSPLINTELIKMVWTAPLEFIRECGIITLSSIKEVSNYIVEIKRNGSFVGVYYVTSTMAIILSIIVGVIKKNRGVLSSAICFTLMILSIWLLYDARTGSRHLMACCIGLIIIDSILIVGNEWPGIVTFLMIDMIMACFTFCCESDYDIKPPKEDIVLENAINNNDFRMVFAEDRWDNTVIWSLSCDYRYLYGLPSGVGINICTDDFVIKNANKLKSKYIAINKENTELMIVANDTWTYDSQIGNVVIFSTR